MKTSWPILAPLSKKRLNAELESLLNWWIINTIDRKRGGYIGRIDGLGIPHTSANKSVNLTADLIIAFSEASYHTGSEFHQGAADRAFTYLTEHFWDPLHFGVFEEVDPHGEVINENKHIRSQAACLNALATYARITKNTDASAFAKTCFTTLEEQARDLAYGGYHEILAQDWSEPDQPIGLAAKTMATHLEILQAYTAMVRLDANAGTNASLRHAIITFSNKIIDPTTGHLRLRMDSQWNRLDESTSYGRDIQASWMLHDAAQVLGDEDILTKVKEISINIAKITLAQGLDPRDGALLLLLDGNVLNPEKHWWSQVEAVVGFLNAYQLSNDSAFLKAANSCWNFVDKHIIDRENGEWFWGVDEQKRPLEQLDKVNNRKSPLPAVRMCLQGLALLETNPELLSS